MRISKKGKTILVIYAQVNSNFQVREIFSERPGGNKMALEVMLWPLISYKVLKTRQYIVNDTLFVQVDVGPDD